MYDPEDDDEVSPEEYAEIMAGMKEAGFIKEDGTLDREAIDNAEYVPFTEFDEWYEAKQREEQEHSTK